MGGFLLLGNYIKRTQSQKQLRDAELHVQNRSTILLCTCSSMNLLCLKNSQSSFSIRCLVFRVWRWANNYNSVNLHEWKKLLFEFEIKKNNLLLCYTRYNFQVAYVFANQRLVGLCSLVGETLTLHLEKQLQKRHNRRALIMQSYYAILKKNLFMNVPFPVSNMFMPCLGCVYLFVYIVIDPLLTFLPFSSHQSHVMLQLMVTS